MTRYRPAILQFLLVLILCMSHIAYGLNPYPFKHYNTENGLSQISILSIYEDMDGFLWFGTRNGLNFFDGHQFEIFYSDPWDENSLKNNVVNTITGDSSGLLWIGTESGLCSYNKEFHQFERFDLNGLNRIEWNISSIAFDNDDNLLITSNLGIHFLDRKTGNIAPVVVEIDPDQSDYHMYCHHKDDNGNIWFGGANGMYKVNMVRRTTTKQNISFNNQELKSVESIERQGDVLFLSTGKEIWKVNAVTFETISVINNEFQGEIFESRKMLLLPDDKLWVASYKGVFSLDLESLEYTSRMYHSSDDPRSLSDNSVHAMHLGKNADIWVGTYSGGLNYYSSYQNIFDLHQHSINNPNYSINSNIVNAFEEDSNGILYIATGRGGLNVYNPSTEQYDYLFEELNIRNLYLENDSWLWIGTYYSGIVKMNLKTRETIYYNSFDSGIIPRNTNHITYQHSNGEIYVASWNKLYLFNSETNRFTQYSHRVSDENDFHIVEKILEVEGDLWLITNAGIHVFNTSKKKFVKEFRHEKGNRNTLPSDVLFWGIIDNNGKIWISSQGGLSYFIPESSTFRTFTTKDGLPSNMLVCMQVDESNNIWISSINGLSVLNQETMKFRRFDQTNNLQSFTFRERSCFKCNDGSLIFGGMNGFNKFQPSAIKHDPNPPDIKITDLMLFNKVISPENNPILERSITRIDTLNLHHFENVIKLSYVAIDYSEPYKNQYAYMMEGYEKEWNYVGTQRTATYTNLAPGEYTFRVKASNGEGTWNEEGTSLSIIIIPPFYQTAWFQSSMIAIIVLGAFAFHKIRLRHHKRAKVHLKNTVAERTLELKLMNTELERKNEEINEQKEEIEAQKDNIEETLRDLQQAKDQLIESEKMASIGILTAGLAHELNNPLNYIAGMADPIKQDLEELTEQIDPSKSDTANELITEIRNLLSMMVDGAQKATSIIRNLLDISPRGPEGVDRLFNLNEIVSATASLISKSNQKIAINVDLKDSIDIIGNQVEVNQVIINIIQNAMDALDSTDHPTINIVGTKSLDSFELSISDNGEGMAPEEYQKIFEPFYTTKAPGKGTGLGLYISYSIIKKHGGKISVESEEGKGTTFIINLPFPAEDQELKQAN